MERHPSRYKAPWLRTGIQYFGPSLLPKWFLVVPGWSQNDSWRSQAAPKWFLVVSGCSQNIFVVLFVVPGCPENNPWWSQTAPKLFLEKTVTYENVCAHPLEKEVACESTINSRESSLWCAECSTPQLAIPHFNLEPWTINKRLMNSSVSKFRGFRFSKIQASEGSQILRFRILSHFSRFRISNFPNYGITKPIANFTNALWSFSALPSSTIDQMRNRHAVESIQKRLLRSHTSNVCCAMRASACIGEHHHTASNCLWIAHPLALKPFRHLRVVVPLQYVEPIQKRLFQRPTLNVCNLLALVPCAQRMHWSLQRRCQAGGW